MQTITVDQRFTRAAGVAAAGGIVALAIVLNDHSFRGDWGFVRAALTGAFLAGMTLAGGFGGEGLWGWFRAGLTFAGCTILGAILAVPLMWFDTWLMQSDMIAAVSGLGAMSLLGPVYVLGMIVEKYIVWAAWAAAFIVMQGVLIWGR